MRSRVVAASANTKKKTEKLAYIFRSLAMNQCFNFRATDRIFINEPYHLTVYGLWVNGTLVAVYAYVKETATCSCAVTFAGPRLHYFCRMFLHLLIVCENTPELSSVSRMQLAFRRFCVPHVTKFISRIIQRELL